LLNGYKRHLENNEEGTLLLEEIVNSFNDFDINQKMELSKLIAKDIFDNNIDVSIINKLNDNFKNLINTLITILEEERKDKEKQIQQSTNLPKDVSNIISYYKKYIKYKTKYLNLRND
jgi:hypothetical protein